MIAKANAMAKNQEGKLPNAIKSPPVLVYHEAEG